MDAIVIFGAKNARRASLILAGVFMAGMYAFSRHIETVSVKMRRSGMYVCMHVCMCICVYVRVYVFVCSDM